MEYSIRLGIIPVAEILYADIKEKNPIKTQFGSDRVYALTAYDLAVEVKKAVGLPDENKSWNIHLDAETQGRLDRQELIILDLLES